MKYTYSIFFLLININLNCQITIVDNDSIPISSVELYSNRKTLLALSNDDGEVQWNKLQNQTLTDTIYFNHINYDSKWIIRKNIGIKDTIILSATNHQLPEIFVAATKNKISKKYQSINALYKSYQTNNDSLIYYTDGQIDYLSKVNKFKYRRKLGQYRTYLDSAYISNREKRKIEFQVGLPSLRAEYLPKTYFQSKDLELYKNVNGTIEIISKNEIQIGRIKEDSTFVSFFYNDIFSNKSRGIGKVEALQTKSEVTLVFKRNSNKGDFLIDSFDDLVYSKIERQYNLKQDKEITKIEQIEEICIEGFDYMNEVEIDLYSKGFGFPKGNNYQNHFWKEFKWKRFYSNSLEDLLSL